MGERVRHKSEVPLQKDGKRARSEEDRISQLPDDILVSILSYLTLKEAAATCLLSRRWVNLWTFIARLNFNYERWVMGWVDMEDERGIRGYLKLLKKKRYDYVKRVNRVLKLHKGSVLEEFTICYNLNISFKHAIDKWLSFALRKGVQRLELDFSEYLCLVSERYAFPLQFSSKCGSGSSLEQPRLTYRSRYPCEFLSFKPLKALCLKNVNVCGEVLEFLLSYCPVLERLVVHGSVYLVNLQVSGPALALKYLDICFCFRLKSIKICNTNILSFTYWGKSIHLVLENVPLLSEVSIGGNYSGFASDVLPKLSCCLTQLEVLKLLTRDLQVNMELLELPELTKLKQLVLRIDTRRNMSLIGFTSLIKASPHLEKFVLQLRWYAPGLRRKKYPMPVSCPHPTLKVVELSGYNGCTSDLELATYFFENAVALEKVIIKPWDEEPVGYPVSTNEIQKVESARRSAKNHLEGKVPPQVELVIL